MHTAFWLRGLSASLLPQAARCHEVFCGIWYGHSIMVQISRHIYLLTKHYFWFSTVYKTCNWYEINIESSAMIVILDLYFSLKSSGLIGRIPLNLSSKLIKDWHSLKICKHVSNFPQKLMEFNYFYIVNNYCFLV